MSRAATAGFASLVFSVMLVGAVRRYALWRDLLDHPNARSSHAQPTPRGGGLGVLVACLLVAGVGLRSEPLWHATATAFAGVILVALIGWLDDHGGLGVRMRLAAHITAGALVAPLAVQAQAGDPATLVALLGIGCVVSSINVVNFIDGIDGMIGTQALVLGLHVVYLSAPAGSSVVLGAALAGASLGFLMFNWAPARIFLGDAGSGGLGALFVVSAFVLASESDVGVVEALLPLFPIFLDATVTLARRLIRGEQVTQAHRSHLYQRLANGGWGHARVTMLFAATSLVAIPVGAAAAGMAPRASWALLLSYGGAVCAGYALIDTALRRRVND